MSARDIIEGFAVGAQAIANASDDHRVAMPARGAAMLLQLVAKLVGGRSDDEAIAILRRIVEEGADPLDDEELDAQVEEILAEFDVL